YGIRKMHSRHFWATLLGAGLVPAVLLLYSYLTAKPCPPQMEIGDCTSFPPGYLDVVALFAVVALVGMVWGLLRLTFFSGHTTTVPSEESAEGASGGDHLPS